ncbi:hypothetical protein EMIHUDRAFT_199455 [Emiliania huxleyi CCMP1516]|uniref:Serine/threonine-protein phosphatase PGAM5, mitochondrial n=2 Tax=Emiliania huxleyi TaxID=2903 RepID=A0A0D3KZM5_EMIH1|nr:hypothetical protein EMIHUDRAFT_199455 [Emiliania huxleyi CCMP1516]EOD41210.1 hypothetical protein EMIHUDRAFT_199455 [Emiliania huxleyi CCMP1516]|eukprot:XP_005793639.1 hypothetical protein EMIHUDRAFT_199455 [Emiliania huxleyi CCMP1516]
MLFARATADDDIRFQDLPAEYEEQRFLPARPYPAWDRNWDYCEPSDREVARALRHAWPIADYADAVRSLYAEHTNRSSERVERLLERTPEAELPALYRRAYLEHAYGGVPDRDFGMPLDEAFPRLDAEQTLTPLGRQQATATGRRIAEMLRGALQEEGREAHVRLHETADLIAAELPAGRGALADGAREVHVEGARMEAAYRALHEYDIVVCHGNVIRYMALRALQLPPEAWLRLCTYNCSLTHLKIRPTGSVSMISLGDTGHLSLDETSFSMHAGYECFGVVWYSGMRKWYAGFSLVVAAVGVVPGARETMQKCAAKFVGGPQIVELRVTLGQTASMPSPDAAARHTGAGPWRVGRLPAKCPGLGGLMSQKLPYR